MTPSPSPEAIEAEKRLDKLFSLAFDVNHKASKDYAILKMELKSERAKAKRLVEVLEAVNLFLPEAMEILKELLEDAKRCYIPEKGWPPHIEAAKAMLLPESDQQGTLKDVEEALKQYQGDGK